MRTRAVQSAFTLVELLIVMIIVGILSLIAFVGYTQYSAKAKAAEARANIGSVKQLVEARYAETGTQTTGSAYAVWGDTIRGKYYDDYTITGAVDTPSGRFVGTITASARTGAPANCAITYALNGTTTEANWP